MSSELQQTGEKQLSAAERILQRRQAATGATQGASQAQAATASQLTEQEQNLKNRVESGNAIFQIILAPGKSSQDKQAKIEAVVQYLTQGVEDGTAKAEDFDNRRDTLADFNAYVQMARKSLSKQQAYAVTDKAYADFQRIMDDTAGDLQKFEAARAPLTQLATLFETYGADGDIFEKIKQAREQKRLRDEADAAWTKEHEDTIQSLEDKIRELDDKIVLKEEAIAAQAGRFFGRKATIQLLTADKEKYEADKLEYTQLLTEEKAKTLPEHKADPAVEQVEETILKLQDISGEPFQKKIVELRELALQTIDRLDSNFLRAIDGLQHTGKSFTSMGRNASDCDFMLSVLEVGIRRSEETIRTHAAAKLNAKASETDAESNADMARLDAMEQNRRGKQLLEYSNQLGDEVGNIAGAIASLRTSQTTIDNMVRMNASALKTASQSRETGIANTSDAVAVTIATIIQSCLRGTTSALVTATESMRSDIAEGNMSLMDGVDKDLQRQNEQARDFIQSLIDLKAVTEEMSKGTIARLREGRDLYEQMRAESQNLADATADAAKASLTARMEGPAPESTRPGTTPKPAANGNSMFNFGS